MVKDFTAKDDLVLFTSGSRFTIGSVFLDQGMKSTLATFDLFIRELPRTRNYFVAAGLEHVISYLKGLRFGRKHLKWMKETGNYSEDALKYFKKFKFTGDVWAMPEGTIFFPGEPIIRITAPIIEAQLIEMFLINNVMLQTNLFSKIVRFQDAANGKEVVMGFNRSLGADVAMKSTRINKILGIKTSFALYDYLHGDKPPFSVGTFHYFLMAFPSELEAMRAYMKSTKGKGYVLVDTYDFREGLENFISAAKELERRGYRSAGIQLDSGDLYRQSIEARRRLDAAGLTYCKIFIMSNLDEWKVDRLEKRRAPADVYAGVTELLNLTDSPSLEVVYKLCEIIESGRVSPKFKLSSQKMSLPGRKQVFRRMKHGEYCSDTIGLQEERLPGKALLQPIFKSGKCIYKIPTLRELAQYFRFEKARFSERLFDVGKKSSYKVDISPGLSRLVKKMKRQRTHP